jgi:hypothetical protein
MKCLSRCREMKQVRELFKIRKSRGGNFDDFLKMIQNSKFERTLFSKSIIFFSFLCSTPLNFWVLSIILAVLRGAGHPWGCFICPCMPASCQLPGQSPAGSWTLSWQREKRAKKMLS